MRDRRSNSSPSSDAAIDRVAADWIARLDRGLSPTEAAEFAAWEAAEPRHSAALARLNTTWQALDTADEVPEIMQLVHEMETPPARCIRRRWAWATVALGAAAALTVMWTILSRTPSTTPAPALAENPSYKVIPSSAQRLLLADGTVVELNADSAVEPSFTDTERRVRLVCGEAHFKVSKDATRPFIVQAGKVAVQAVGTAFSIRLDSAVVEVLVTEGRVRVDDATRGESLLVRSEATAPTLAPPVLSAGERVLIPVTAAPMTPVAVTPADLERALTWQSTQLVFERTPLDQVIAAFNSFNRTRLVVGDPSLRTRRLGGTFRADNMDAFVRLLESGFEIVAEQRGENEIVLRAAK
jgi:transmembrane sensor